jgi:hypothetical protein
VSRALASVVLRDEQDEPMGFVRYTPLSGWLWACSLCPAANRPGAGAPAPEAAVGHLVDHIGRAHP